jgi:unsaturated rhamnogalacturonyl hydrolase
MHTETLTPELVERVARHTTTREMEAEDWQKAVALNGLLATEKPAYVDAAQKLVDRSIATQTSAGQLTYGSLDYKPWVNRTELQSFKGQSDPAAVGQAVLDCYRKTGDETYRDAAKRQFEFFDDVERTAEGGIPHIRERTELWVDAIYMVCPFFARYGDLVDKAGFEEAVRQVRVQSKYLQDPHTGLFRHAWRECPNMYPSSTFWSRGNGWAAAGILDTLEWLPDDHEGRGDIESSFLSLAETALDLQDSSGYWHHILDDRTSPLEASGTLMFSYAFKRAYNIGLLDDDAYAAAARRGIDICCGVVDDEGAVHRIAEPPGGERMPLGVTSYGQGWFLLAASQFDDGSLA